MFPVCMSNNELAIFFMGPYKSLSCRVSSIKNSSKHSLSTLFLIGTSKYLTTIFFGSYNLCASRKPSKKRKTAQFHRLKIGLRSLRGIQNMPDPRDQLSAYFHHLSTMSSSPL